MTEQQAIKILKNISGNTKVYENDVVFTSDFVKAYELATQALEEIQQYRAIGTPTQIYEKIGGLDVELGKYHAIGTVEKIKEKLALLGKYEDLGTVEELDETINMFC